MILSIVKSIGSLASSYVDGKVQTQKIKAEIQKKQLTGEIDWDLEAIRATQSSWKDEWFVIVLSIPLVLAFIPGTEGWVDKGFEQLSKAPDWYFYSLGIAISASFGVRAATKFFKK